MISGNQFLRPRDTGHWLSVKVAGGVSIVAQEVKNPSSIHENSGFIPGLAQGDQDPALLWLWCRTAAVALI